MFTLKNAALILFFFLLLSTITVYAGDHKALCQKSAEADLVFEIQFTVRGHYPEKYLNKGWAPPDSILMETAKTGKITRVFKGPLQSGDPWREAYGIFFRQGASVKKWSAFFNRETFSMVAFLKRKGDRYETTGWAEETAGCSISPHYSWCSDYAAYKEKVQKCLGVNSGDRTN